MAALPGLLAATLAALAELLVLSGSDRPLGPLERGLQRITAAWVAGLSILGIVVAILTVTFRGPGIPSPTSWLAAAAIIVAAIGDGLIWRAHPRTGPSDMTSDERAVTLQRLALAQAVGILGFALGFLVIRFA